MRRLAALLIPLVIAFLPGCGQSKTTVSGTGGSGGIGRGGGSGTGGSVGGSSGNGARGGASGAGGSGPTSEGIVVNTPSGRAATETMDGYCDILEAAATARSGQSVRECSNQNGIDRIILTAGFDYPMTKPLRLDTAVAVKIADGATGSATISAAAGWVTNPADSATSCLVHVSGSAANVKLNDVTLTQDPSLSLSGVCATLGFLDVRRGHVTGFRQGGIVATCLPASGCDHDAPEGDYATTIRVLGSLIDDNRSPRNGGGISSEGSGATVVVEHSTIVNNVSDLSGGGLYFAGGWGTNRIDSSTISGNSAATGGGVSVKFAHCTNTYLYVLNSTIARNTASRSGGGIEFHAEEDATCPAQDVTVLASIVSNNAATTTMESNINADWNGGQFNCDRGSLIYVAPGLPRPSQALGTACAFNVPDALLAPLMRMGGTGDLPLHPLLKGSPAIDAAVDDMVADQQRDGWIALVDPPSPPTWTLFDRVVDGDGNGSAIRDLGAYEVNDVWQTELLAVQAKGPASHTVVTTPAGYNRDAGTTYAASNATNQFVTYVLPIAEAGNYQIKVGVQKTGNGGQFQLAIASSPDGPWTDVGTVQDAYAAAATFVELSLVPDPTLTAGRKLFRFTVTGKNAAGAGYQLLLDYIKTTKLP